MKAYNLQEIRDELELMARIEKGFPRSRIVKMDPKEIVTIVSRARDEIASRFVSPKDDVALAAAQTDAWRPLKSALEPGGILELGGQYWSPASAAPMIRKSVEALDRAIQLQQPNLLGVVK